MADQAADESMEIAQEWEAGGDDNEEVLDDASSVASDTDSLESRGWCVGLRHR